MTEQDSKRYLAAVAVATSLFAAGREASAGAYLDGPPGFVQSVCTGTGNPVIGVQARAGYYVDAALQLPQIDQVTYMHAVGTNMNPCGGEAIGFDFFLPAGARLAITDETPVKCYIGNGTTSADVSANCLQEPEIGQFGGLFFGFQSGLAPGWSFEVQVPIVFERRAVSDILVWASSAAGPVPASVTATVPYVPPPPPQPMPDPYALGDDLAILGSAAAGNTLPVAFSNDDGTFTVTNHDVGNFASWARTPNVKRLAGDFDGDGRTDYALVGGAGWGTIPVARSRGDGSFSITNAGAAQFATLASQPNAVPLVGDFNADGFADIALVGGPGWPAIPVAFGAGAGTFSVTNVVSPMSTTFASWAAQPGVKAVTGDFNKDGRTDIALVGNAGWTTLPTAFSYGDGGFLVTNRAVELAFQVVRGNVIPGANFAQLAAQPNVKVLTGDFNKDGFADLALVGGAGWSTIPLAMSYGDGSYQMRNTSSPTFAAWAATPGAVALTGDFNGDGYTDIALTGVAGWTTLPIALSAGFGAFTVVNNHVGLFGTFASQPGVRAIAGDFNGDGHTDVALTGGAGWGSIPVALGLGYGTFATLNEPAAGFGTWAGDAGASILRGRVN